MTNRQGRGLNKLKRVKQFGVDHPLTPANPVATGEYTAVSDSITTIEDLAESQLSGSGTISGAVDERLVLEADLLSMMSGLAKAAKTLDTTLYPDVATKMRMGDIGSFQELITRAQLFVSTIEPIVAQLTALGASETVVADLNAKIAALQGSSNLKLTGLDTQVGGTLGLDEAIRTAMKHVQKLDAILTQVYRTNPVLLGRWKTAKRMEADPVTETQPTPEGGSGGSQPVGS